MTKTMGKEIIDIKSIIRYLPHRYPFLLIDRVTYDPEINIATGLKNVSINESFFQGHFPGNPIMPGVLILEALAQTSGILVCKLEKISEKKRFIVYFSSIENAKFRSPVIPGDQLLLETSIIKSKLNFWKIRGIAKVDDKVVAEAIFSALLVKEDE